MSADAPSSPKDVADLLEALARRLRNDPSFARASPTTPPPRRGMDVAAPRRIEPPTSDEGPTLGEADVFSDGRHVTVTVEAHNVDPASVHVSLVGGRLLIGVGEGDDSLRRDLPLPAPVKEDGCFATLRNGVLDVVLPLKEPGR